MKTGGLQAEKGFTLIEAIMVITITGIIAAVVAVFIRKPVEGYFDTVRRAELTDAADVALRRMARDVRLALPNSLRVMNSGGNWYIEFIMTSAGGRYRDLGDGSTGGNILDFDTASNLSFDVLGDMPANPAIAANDYIVVHNLGTSYAPGDAYDCSGQCNRALVAGLGAGSVTLASNPFAAQSPKLRSPNARFQVVPGDTKAVTFACPSVSAGNLTRHWNYGFNAAQAAPAGGSSGTLVGGALCAVEYTTNVSGRTGMLLIRLTLADAQSGESVSLFNQIHVDNSP